MTPEDRAASILEDLRFLLDDEDKFSVLVEAIRAVEEEAAAAVMRPPEGVTTGVSEAAADVSEATAWTLTEEEARRLYVCRICGLPYDPDSEDVWTDYAGTEHKACTRRLKEQAEPTQIGEPVTGASEAAELHPGFVEGLRPPPADRWVRAFGERVRGLASDPPESVDMSAQIEQARHQIHKKRGAVLEGFARAFLEKTGASPLDVTLVEQRKSDGVTRWWFERKKE
jgi:hypothetical protein